MDAAVALREAVERIPAIDQHAHLLSAPAAEHPPLTDLLTESTEPEQAAQMREHPVYLRAVRDLAALLVCDPTEEAVASTRDRLGVDAYGRRLMEACGFEAMFVDDGFPVPNAASFEEHAALAGCPVRRVIRVESIAEAAASGTPAPPFDTARERFRAMIER